jgi:hypothetical protein
LHHLYQKSIKFSSLGFKAWLLDVNLRCLSLVLSLKSVNDGQIILCGWLLLLLVMSVGYVVLEEEKRRSFLKMTAAEQPSEKKLKMNLKTSVVVINKNPQVEIFKLLQQTCTRKISTQ